MFGPFVHNIDPIITSISGVHLWWYGTSFTLGFLNAHLFLRRNRERIGLSMAAVYDLTLLLAVGVLVGGRAVVVINNEWEFYRDHLLLIPSIWVGGFASHGLIFGGAVGVGIFCLLYKFPIRPLLDVLAISAAIILGFGRVGNFIDGQIFGSLTDLPWSVQFPGVEGFRHPVVLYDGLKNFLLVPLLLWIRSRGVPPGRIAVIFVILYAGLRIPIDLLREYPTTMWGLPNGQMLNILMVAFGVVALYINLYRSRRNAGPDMQIVKLPDGPTRWRVAALVSICVIPLVIPSDATRDVPATYGKRHPGLEHSWMYPAIAEELAAAEREKEGRP
ncbi:MAG: prolipoprotein diacylglyceryl transferase [Pyrinomonadaceae bacterium]|nr:prolipoprotein diacylglyceryl transferase [Pyrinomonadaceae bacterium]